MELLTDKTNAGFARDIQLELERMKFVYENGVYSLRPKKSVVVVVELQNFTSKKNWTNPPKYQYASWERITNIFFHAGISFLCGKEKPTAWRKAAFCQGLPFIRLS